ncbi:uncharacterized protein [Notothenia coriiceps]|uniref:Ig-like domain-containing protein n=1 Tax=Notothenia coriiceps TaxID=8208 RepID=A0A6I9PCJ9_9TELE|nr:PREDICTED: uncharacterized protein LOC104958484 [Notothenia coriiceps]
MTPPNVALHVLCLLLANVAYTTTWKSSSHYHSYVGESVTLPCAFDDFNANTVMFYWYRQTLGQKPELVSTFYRHNDKKGSSNDGLNKPSRFSLDPKEGTNNLKITHLQISDSATYFCVGSDLYSFKFVDGITVDVKESGLNILVSVHQSASEIIQPGDSVTLNCTVHTGSCDGEHSVYWFKNSEDSPGLLYTRGGSQCERKPNTQTHTCVYNLPMENLHISHAGTYYCAVALCGHILFGNGTKLDFEAEVLSLALVYFLTGALAATIILIVLLAISVYKMNQRNCQHSECNATFSTSSTLHTEQFGQDAENLHYAALRQHNGNRSRREGENTQSECVYSSYVNIECPCSDTVIRTMESFTLIAAVLLCSLSWISASSNRTVQPGEEVTLLCPNIYGAGGEASYCDGYQHETFEMSSNLTTVFLKIKQVDISDSGLYFCGFYKGAGTVISSAIQLNVEGNGESDYNEHDFETKKEPDEMTYLMSLILGCLAFLLTIVIIVLAVKIRKLQRDANEESQTKRPQNMCSDELNYVALSFQAKPKRSRRPASERELEPNVVYAATR